MKKRNQRKAMKIKQEGVKDKKTIIQIRVGLVELDKMWDNFFNQVEKFNLKEADAMRKQYRKRMHEALYGDMAGKKK